MINNIELRVARQSGVRPIPTNTDNRLHGDCDDSDLCLVTVTKPDHHAGESDAPIGSYLLILTAPYHHDGY